MSIKSVLDAFIEQEKACGARWALATTKRDEKVWRLCSVQWTRAIEILKREKERQDKLVSELKEGS